MGRKQGGFSSVINNKTQRKGVIKLVPDDTKLEAETRQEIDAKLEVALKVFQSVEEVLTNSMVK